MDPTSPVWPISVDRWYKHLAESLDVGQNADMQWVVAGEISEGHRRLYKLQVLENNQEEWGSFVVHV
jgi:hypothetical protein